MRRLIEGGAYSGAALIRVNTVCFEKYLVNTVYNFKYAVTIVIIVTTRATTTTTTTVAPVTTTTTTTTTLTTVTITTTYSGYFAYLPGDYHHYI